MAKRKGPTAETAEKAKIKQYLRMTGWFVYHNLAGLGCFTGLADLTAIKGSNVIQIEIKAGKGKQSEGQEKFQNDWELHGGHYFCGNYEGLRLFLSARNLDR
ncbi:MAG: hypothetical protein ACTSQ8_24255 [Candidatus Helarchaeota archaeon]